MDGREANSRCNGGRCCRVTKPGKSEKKTLIDVMKELGQKYGVKVSDLSERGVRAIGIIGGGPQAKSGEAEVELTRQPEKHRHQQANKRRKVV